VIAMPTEPWPVAEPIEVPLACGDARAVVDLRGGGLRELTVGPWAVLDGYPAGSVRPGFPGAVLLPWPNRLRHGRWRWRDRDLQLPVWTPEEPHAIHGLLTDQPWTVLAQDGASATVGAYVAPHLGYPFRLAAAVDYALGADRLAVTVRVRNEGADPAPFGAGCHPYLGVGAVDDAELTLPARTELLLDGGLPTGQRRPFDGAVGRIGDRAFDTPFTDLIRDDDGWAHVRLRGPAGRLELAVDAAWPWLQVFSGDGLPGDLRRRSLAVEPMTCPPNALADGVDLVVLDPGEHWAGRWTLSWTET
jgi:aldose 1-epimerase